MANIQTEELLTIFGQGQGPAWWTEITTNSPRCIYYFGPFLTSAEAQGTYSGYVEDLESEGAQGIVVKIKYCQPDMLTVFDEMNSSSRY